MVQQSKRDITNKLSVLEYVIGFRQYSVYISSPDFDSNDIVSVQKEAVRMLRHLNMDDYLAVIAYTKEKPNTGGHIELNDADDSKNIFINISIEYQGHNDSVLCVMAHEICHKLLHIRKFKGATTDENEVYTDLAAIYSGFGRQILNGCYREWETKGQFSLDNKITHRLTIGYLTVENYAYAYSIMCSLNGVTFNQYSSGLLPHASRALLSNTVPRITVEDFDAEMLKKTQQYGDMIRDIAFLEKELVSIKQSIGKKLSKYDYAPDVRTWNGFSKPATAYSLLLEPDMQEEAKLLHAIVKEKVKDKDFFHLKTISCPYCMKEVTIPSDLSDNRYSKFKCLSCGKTFTVGLNDYSEGLNIDDPQQVAKKKNTIKTIFKKIINW